jgi:calcineurin-like phosphoesterase family protein
MKKFFPFLFLILCANALQAFQQQTPIHSVFLIGDAGEPFENPVLIELKKELDKIGDKGTVIFLGDNIYPKGLPPVGHKLRAEAEIAINGQINAVKDFQGNKFFIPGNHDWAQGRENGLEWLQLQEKYVEAALDSQDVFLPSKGCAGPVEINLTDQITLVIIDTQSFIHKGTKPDLRSGCGVSSPVQTAVLLKDILERNAHKKVIVTSHHPMYTYGIHGGVFSAKDHLFPLTASKPMKNFYLPLPIIGSIYPLYRTWFGNIQDTAHPLYQQFRDAMVSLMKLHPDIVHAAGHEHALEHIEKEGMDFIVSGAGAKNNAHVKQKGDAQFAQNTMGYARIDYFENGETVLKFYTPDEGGVKEIYSKVISTTPFRPSTDEIIANYKGSFEGRDTLFAASDKYSGRSNFHKKLLGENYRKEWAAKIKVPMFDLGTEHGGLSILKRGGGHQTLSLRLEAENGKQYVLRSMDKNPALALPPELRNTFVKYVVQDGISASHPYAPFVIPSLADAAGIFHTNPKVVFIPDDPRFGIYRKDFANTLALYEERPNKAQVKSQSFFGKADGVISTPDLEEKKIKDHDNKVDEIFVARNRLFDFWLGDWDRHQDQWRWAEYDLKDDKKIYKPIPRDRDQAFFVGEGSFKKLVSSKWAQPDFKGFDDNIEFIHGMGFSNVRHFDRQFLSEPSRSNWVQQANELQQSLTDEIIENAINQWPSEIFDSRGQQTINNLISRRNHLEKYANEYYDFLSKEVDVLGSNKNEFFKISRLSDENTKVTVYKISKKGNRDEILYERNFKTRETNEIRLFGLGGKDEFKISGDVKKGITIRIIGGDDDDIIVDESSVQGTKKHTIVYDVTTGTSLTKGKDTKDLTTDKDPEINRYNRQEFDFDVKMPLVSLSFNQDDGIFIGGGIMIKKDGFRKEPYASKQTITGNFAFSSSSYNFKYDGEFIDVIGKVDFNLDAELLAPNFVNNFYGIGNETENDKSQPKSYYRTRFKALLINPSFQFNIGSKANLKLGVRYSEVQVEESSDRFITNFPENNLDPDGLFDLKSYGGGSIAFEFDTKDNEIMAKRGVTFNTSLFHNNGLNSGSNNSTRWVSDLTLRWSLGHYSRTTIATRVGYQKSFGDYEFYQTSRLDGFDNLRGYNRFRFAGESSFYNQIDIRIDLFEWNNYILPSKFGLILFNDIGRVWVPGEDSNKMHHGYGGGIYIMPLGRFAFNLLLAKSEERLMTLLKFGFFF